MQDRNYDMLQQMLSAHKGEGLEEKLKGLMNDPTHRKSPNWQDEEEFYRRELEPKYVIIKHRGSYCFRAAYTDMHRSLLGKDEIMTGACDGGGFWGVDGENHSVTLYDSSSDFGRPKHIEEAIRNDGERLLKLLGEVGDKQGNKFDLTGYDVTYIDAIGHRHIVKPLTAEEREEIRKRREAEMAGEQVKNPTMWASGKNPHKHYGGRQDPKDYAKKKKAKRRQQKQARHRNK